jgi:hypothetical protein
VSQANIMTRSALVMLIGLAACGGPVPEPIVDMTGVDQVQYNKDLADCYKSIPFIAAGNPVTSCMEEKGYKILVRR